MCLVERMEKKRNRKFICLVEKKNEMMENEVGINLQLYPHQIKQKSITFFFIKNIVYGHPKIHSTKHTLKSL